MYRFFVWNYLNSKKIQFSNLNSPGPILNFYMWFCRNFPELLEFRNCYSNLGQGDRNPKFFIPNQALALQAKIEAEPISAQEAMAEAKHRAELAANDMLQPALHKSAVC